jgi:hypothetical protein
MQKHVDTATNSSVSTYIKLFVAVSINLINIWLLLYKPYKPLPSMLQIIGVKHLWIMLSGALLDVRQMLCPCCD